MKRMARLFGIVIVLSLSFIIRHPNFVWGLEPKQVLVVANKRAWYSVKLAKYYMRLRNIPSDNLIQLTALEEEICGKEDYEKNIAPPVRAFLKKRIPAATGSIVWSP